jgi:hypothetical protein
MSSRTGQQNRASYATIAFLESDRPRGTGADDPYGDDAIVGVAPRSDFGRAERRAHRRPRTAQYA